MTGEELATLALLLSLGNWAFYWPRIGALRVPLRPWGHQTTAAAGLLLGLCAWVAGVDWGAGLAAGTSILLSGMFLFFTLNSGMPGQRPAVALGEVFPDFQTLDAEGEVFRLSELAGRNVLLKFYRGHW